jgi:hypothetical protein
MAGQIPGSVMTSYEGSPLEEISSRDLIAQEPKLELRGINRVRIAGGLVVGGYGEAGCLLVNCPADQFDAEGNSIDSQGLRIKSPIPGPAFRLVRAFMIPAGLRDQVDDLAHPLGTEITQEHLEGSEEGPRVPGEDRMTCWPGFGGKYDGIDSSRFGLLLAFKLGVVENILNGSTDEPVSYEHHYYTSLHRYSDFQSIVDLAQLSLRNSVANVDQMIADIDTDHVIAKHDFGDMTQERAAATD